MTPFASPALGRIDVSGLEDAGRMLEQRAQYDQNRTDRLAKEARDYELEKQHRAAADEYYRMEAETHRMNQQNAKNAANEKRTQVLFDAFRKAKTPTDRKAIMDELKRLGFTVEEQASEFQGASPVQAPKAPIAPTPEKAAMGLIDSYDMPQVKGERSALEMRNYGPVLGVAGAGAASGEAGGATASGEISEPAGKGKFVIKDSYGVPVHTYDEPMERERTRTIARQMLGGLKDASVTDRERGAYQAAEDAAVGQLDLTGDPAKALDAGLNTYKVAIGMDLRRTYPQGKGGAPAGPTRIGLRQTAMDRQAVDQIIRRVDKDGNAKGQIEGINVARRAISSLDSGSGIGDLDAFKSYLLAMSGKVVTDKEMEQFMNSSGVWTGWEKKYNEYAAQGRFPEDFKRPLRAMFERFIKLNRENLNTMASNAREQARLSDLSENDQAIVSGHFTGDFGGGGGAAADTRSDEELVKQWKAGKR